MNQYRICNYFHSQTFFWTIINWTIYNYNEESKNNKELEIKTVFSWPLDPLISNTYIDLNPKFLSGELKNILSIEISEFEIIQYLKKYYKLKDYPGYFNYIKHWQLD